MVKKVRSETIGIISDFRHTVIASGCKCGTEKFMMNMVFDYGVHYIFAIVSISILRYPRSPHSPGTEPSVSQWLLRGLLFRNPVKEKTPQTLSLALGKYTELELNWTLTIE